MAIYKSKRVYYKYQDWEQPVLTANGTLGGDSFAVSASSYYDSSSQAWYAFDGNTTNTNKWFSAVTGEKWLAFYNPIALNVTSLTVYNHIDARWYLGGGTVQASADGVTWENLTTFTQSGRVDSFVINLEFNKKSYKYYRLNNLIGVGSNGEVWIRELKITAQEQITVESTSSDYDYSVVESDKIKDVYKSTERKYYKYGTEINANVTGNFARIDKGVASGFSTSQYLTLPEAFNPQNNPWEALFKVKINTLINGSQIILGQRNSGGYDFYVDVNTVRLGVGGTIFTGTTTLQENTTYWFKYVFTGDAYIVKSSTNGVDWVDEINTASTVIATPTSDDCRIGVWYNTYDSGLGNPWLGSIDLSQSYININGARWWSGDSYTKAGSWIDEGVVNGFSTSNYLMLPKTVSDYNNLEVNIKIKASSLGTLCDCLRFENGGVIFLHTNNYLGYDPANVASTLYPEIDMWYYIKFTHDSSTYTLSYSLDGREYIDVATSQNTTKSTGAVYVGGSSIQTARYWRGSIDFTKSYIKINDKMWWHGTKAVETTPDDAVYSDVLKKRIAAIFRRGETKYYKYQDWEQPVLSSNGTMGGNTVAASASKVHQSYDGQPWRAFNGQEADSSGWATNNEALPQWIMFYNPTPFVLRNFTIVNRNHPWTKFTVQGSNDGNSFVDLETFSNDVLEFYVGWDKSISAQNQGSYKYYRFYITSTSTGGTDVRQIKLYGSVVVEGTSSDYDYSVVSSQRVYGKPTNTLARPFNPNDVAPLSTSQNIADKDLWVFTYTGADANRYLYTSKADGSNQVTLQSHESLSGYTGAKGSDMTIVTKDWKYWISGGMDAQGAYRMEDADVEYLGDASYDKYVPKPDYTTGVTQSVNTVYYADKNVWVQIPSVRSDRAIYVGKTSDSVSIQAAHNGYGGYSADSSTMIFIPKGWYYKSTGVNHTRWLCEGE